MTISDSTIAGNHVTGGAVEGLGGVYVLGKFTLVNSTVAGNTGPSDCAVVAMVSSDHNISGDASCMFGDAGSKQNTNLLLGALQNNGGETDTLAL